MASSADHRYRAFTLPEMLIVVVILTIFSGLAIVSYSGVRNYMRLRTAAREIDSVLSAARAMAINQNGYFRVGIYIDTGMLWIDEIDSFGNLSQPKVVHQKRINNLVKIVSVRVEQGAVLTSGIAYIIFRPDSTAQYSTLYLRRYHSPDVDDNYYTIKVFPATGRARVYPNQRR